MPPKFDPNEIKIVNLRCVGGEVGATSSLAPKIGPLGLSPKKVGDDIAKATSDWKGLKITVQLIVQNRQAQISVVPSAAALLIRALKEPPRDRKKQKNIKHNGNITLEDVISTMPPKFDPNEIKIVNLRCVGGEVGATSSLAPKIGPLGLSPKKVGDDIAKATSDWKGLKITVQLIVQNRQAQISVVPSAAALLIRALKEPPRDRKKQKNIKHNGNITLEDVISIAKTMRPRSMARYLSGTVKEILGTAQSVGCTVEGRAPHDLINDINSGALTIDE
ncbi:unnamed protein product [Chrysodeixis includens]|uniref:Large ribosomal subunit protein uL11 n=3 Tax=Noctuidae TaxID=7100 RepID=A0A9N8L3U2_CHRIL|nr:unnamed protein product [Chrysodeixis includens]